MNIHDALRVIVKQLPLRDILICVKDEMVVCEGWSHNFEHAGVMVNLENPENLDPDALETALIRFAEEVTR